VIDVAARERLVATGRTPYRLSLICATVSCALAPAYTIRWYLGPLPTTLLENAIWLTLLVFVAETLLEREPIEWRTAFTIPAILFLLAGLLDVAFAPDRRAALGLYRAYLVEPMAVFIVLASATRTVRQAWLVLAGLGIGGIALAIPNAAVVIEAIRHHSLNLAGTPPVAIYQTQNAVALFLLPLIAVAASLLLYGHNPERLASALFLVIAVPTFLLTLSRGGYLAIGAVALGLALTHRRRILIVALMALAAALFTRIPAVATRLAHDLNFADPSNTLVGRVPLWRATVQMLRHNPIFGAGLSGFETRIGPYWNATHIDRFIYPHNIVLNFWVATGILGVLSFGWLMVQAFRVSWRGWRHGDRGFAPIELGVFLALVGIVVHGLVDVPYFKNDLSLEFWVLLALCWAGVRWASGAEGRPAGSRALP